MQIGKGASPISSYVAITRVKRRESLLIYRPFDKDLFNQGSLQGPELLLKLLRGVEHIDWKQIELEHMPQGKCFNCGHVQYKEDFAPCEWSRKEKKWCKVCVKEKVEYL